MVETALARTVIVRAAIVALVAMGSVVSAPGTVGAMTLGTHFTVGAGLAYALADSEWEAFVLGFASHALLDAIPHNDETSAITVAAGLAAALLTYRLMEQDDLDWGVVATGGIAGMLPDAEHALKQAGITKRSYYPSHNGMIHQPKADAGTAMWTELGVSLLTLGFSF